MNPIAVIPKSTTHFFWRAVEGGTREGAKEAGAEIIWKGSLKEDDPAQQIQIFEQFVAEGVGGIVLAPIDDAALSLVLRGWAVTGDPVNARKYTNVQIIRTKCASSLSPLV
jgi:ribose transport system substrate-binding protein